VISQALMDALANARRLLANERSAVQKCIALGYSEDTFDLRFARSEVKHFEALVARLERRAGGEK